MPAASGAVLRKVPSLERLGWVEPGGSVGERPLDSDDPQLKGVKSINIQKESLANVIRKRHQERIGCLSLPFTMALFIFYTISVSYHEEVRSVFLLESSVRDYFEQYTFDKSQSKVLHTIAEKRDVWKWLYAVLLPTVFKQDDHLGRALPKEQWSQVLGTNILRGGVLLEQFRKSGSNPPGKPIDAYNWTEVPLYFPGEGMLSITNLPWKTGHSERRLRSGKAVGGKQSIGANKKPDGPEGEPENTYPFLLFEQEPLENNAVRVKYLENSTWVDGATTQLAVKFILLNNDLATVQRVAIRFVFPETGGIYSAVTIQTSFFKGWRTWFVIFADVVTMLLLVYITLVEFRESYVMWKDGQGLEYFRDVWNCLDWVTIILGWAITILFVGERFRNLQLSEVLKKVSREVPDEDYWERMINVHMKADNLAAVNMWYRLLLAYFMLLVMCRFFKAFAGQPRLAVVTNTIYSAGSDLFHFGLIFFCVFLTFAFAGTILFGRRMAGFSSFRTAFGTSFAVACGDFDWRNMSAEHYATSSIWFWSFMILIFLIMLNMVLAIVMDVYTKVRATAVEGDPIWKNAAGWIRKIRRFVHARAKGEGKEAPPVIGEIDILRALDEMGAGKVTYEKLLAAVPGLTPSQAVDVIRDADFLERRNGAGGVSISEAMRLISRINKKVDELAVRHETEMTAEVSYDRKRMARTRARRILFNAMASGRLAKICEEMQNKKVKEHIEWKEIQRKIAKADAIVAARRKQVDGAALRSFSKSSTGVNLGSPQLQRRGSNPNSIVEDPYLPQHGLQDYQYAQAAQGEILNELHSLRSMVINMSKHMHELQSMILHQQSSHGPHGHPAGGFQGVGHPKWPHGPEGPGRSVVPWTKEGQAQPSPMQFPPEGPWHGRRAYDSRPHEPSPHPDSTRHAPPLRPEAVDGYWDPSCTCVATVHSQRGVPGTMEGHPPAAKPEMQPGYRHVARTHSRHGPPGIYPEYLEHDIPPNYPIERASKEMVHVPHRRLPPHHIAPHHSEAEMHSNGPRMHSPAPAHRAPLHRSNTHHAPRSRPHVDPSQFHTSEGYAQARVASSPTPRDPLREKPPRPQKPTTKQRVERGLPPASSGDIPQSPIRPVYGDGDDLKNQVGFPNQQHRHSPQGEPMESRSTNMHQVDPNAYPGQSDEGEFVNDNEELA